MVSFCETSCVLTDLSTVCFLGAAKMESRREKREMVYQTLAHLAQGDRSYTLDGRGIRAVLYLILTFLLRNKLSKYNLLFFVADQ